MIIHRSLPPILSSNEPVAIDLEIWGQEDGKVHHATGTFACASFAVGDDVYMIFDRKQIPNALKNIREGIWIFHNAMYDLRQLRRFTPISRRFVWDTMLVEKVLFGGFYSEFGLDDLARRYLQIHMDKEVRGSFSAVKGGVMTDEQIQYAATDANITLQIYHAQKTVEERRDLSVYYKIDAPSIWVFLDFQPIKIDVDTWQREVRKFQEQADLIADELGFNPRSLTAVKSKVKELTGKVIDSTDDDVLETIDHPVIQMVREGRMYLKCISTYGNKWLENNVGAFNQIIPNWSVIGTITGRVTTSDPSVQQIPTRKFPVYRTFFVPKNGMYTVADCSQQEPRILSIVSGDKELQNIFWSGGDIHLEVSQRVFGADRAAEMRKVAKGINLGTGYGLSALGLQTYINSVSDEKVTVEQCEKFLDEYFKRFRGVKGYIDATRVLAGRREFVESIMGRRVWINLHSRDWKNQCINAPIQSSAADMSKMWLVRLWEKCFTAGENFPVVMFIHDEVVMDHAPEQREMYQKMMQEAFDEVAHEYYSTVPFTLSVASGANWGCKV